MNGKEMSKKESAGEFLIRLGTDARLWAEEFFITFHNGKGYDMDDLIGWFANAIEAGRNAGYWKGIRDVKEGE